jgi:flagellar hook assembly protein FlgD
VTLRIYDLAGSLVRTLIDATAPAGPGMVAWDGRSDRGSDLPAGVYFYRLNGPGFTVNRKIVKQD